ncbi:hypothetical protein BX616_010065 [Lobosporangium transversale]|uniref:Vacuolar calcium ion transporter n=1 Tax=Lobosporangium transversale TaxID=64571 RepID=A0A1Y2H220_9FUNG|nr:Sodium/calcium exchanger protein-domain-containing protein [Lobosporangium transversale]KAF9913415.1 hypothetical protein BX616_010065 [Lobosporangium transversale]ORZ27092.1 Sodium/calcium exchanger protein-domain-containing protein [Lobosporangium transversale]|eukprot:XP_021884839.1 Sodium/calcium exchanger protein-domain-containing protein [Lobosporangium transversale]
MLGRQVTIRSARSLRGVLPRNGIILGSDSGEYDHPKMSLFECVKTILFATRINVLLIFIFLGIMAVKLNWAPETVFLLNFIAIIPLAKLLGYATEEISMRLGENLGALLNASFGNAIELILSVIALKEGKIDVVLGFCFVFGGYYYQSQKFNQTAAQMSASLLSLACMSLLVPAAFVAATDEADQTHSIQILSEGTSIVLLAVYVLYLVFQLKTHTHLYVNENEEEEEAVLPLWAGIALLLVVTFVVALCAEYLVGSIEGLSESWGTSPTFIGLILLPIVGNAAEHVTAVTVAVKNKMDLAIGVAIGSSMQIALFVTPLIVIIGWIIGQPMTLFFNTFETCVLFVSVLIVNYLIQDGESNWLEGVMLLSTYIVIAIAFYVYPATPHH